MLRQVCRFTEAVQQIFDMSSSSLIKDSNGCKEGDICPEYQNMSLQISSQFHTRVRVAKIVLNLPESPKTNTFTLSRDAIFCDSSVPEENSENPACKCYSSNLIGLKKILVQTESRAIRQNLHQSQFVCFYWLEEYVAAWVFFPGLSFQ